MANIAIYNHSYFISHVAMFYKNNMRKIRNYGKHLITDYKMKKLRKNGMHKRMRKAK